MKLICLVSAFIVGFFATIGLRVSRSINSPDPMLVSLAADIPEPYEMKLHWGGMYTNITETGEWEVFRLVDISPDGYQVMMFNETFKKTPTSMDIAYLFPKDEIIARSSIDILQRKPLFLDIKRFEPGDLDNYVKFLDKKGHSGVSINTLINRVIEYSQGDPVITRLSLINGKLDLEPVGL